MAKRESVSTSKRFNLFKRDGFTCQYCGSKPPAVVLELDHILPVAKGGTSVDHNLITSCFTCNRGKSDRLLCDIPQPITEQLQEQVERQQQLDSYNAFLMKARKSKQKNARDLRKYWNESFGVELCDNKGFQGVKLQTMQTFVEKMPVARIMDAVDIARSKVNYESQAFKYFCGVCWSMIKESTK